VFPYDDYSPLIAIRGLPFRREPFFFLPGATGAAMPKMKTHKASKKRFRVTADGKLKRHQAGKKHLLSHKTGKRKRHLRQIVIDGSKICKKYIKVMGGEA